MNIDVYVHVIRHTAFALGVLWSFLTENFDVPLSAAVSCTGGECW